VRTVAALLVWLAIGACAHMAYSWTWSVALVWSSLFALVFRVGIAKREEKGVR
jgi:hypothetical protein